MSNEPAGGEEGTGEVPDAVREWLNSVATERGLSEAELLRAMFAGDGLASSGDVDREELNRLEEEFRSMIDDVRERVIQVKRETDSKAPMEHTHRDLDSSIDRLGDELAAIESDIEALDQRLGAGFENYEEILTYLTEMTDDINRRLSRLASAVIDLREQVGEAAREEVRRTALAHLTQAANRHGVSTARCGDCAETVDIGLLVEPRCPHCDAAFSSLEPKRGFFRKSVLHTGMAPALESPLAGTGSEGALESVVDEAGGDVGGAPAVTPAPGSAEQGTGAGVDRQTDRDSTAGSADGPVPPTDGETDGTGDLQSIDGIGPAYAERLQAAGIDGVLALAVADPEDLGDAIDVPSSTVADWIKQADAQSRA